MVVRPYFGFGLMMEFLARVHMDDVLVGERERVGKEPDITFQHCG